MSKKANPSIIGLFVLGAVVLGVVAILFFGSTTLFTPKEEFVIYFEESVNGLEVGAPVKFKGVPIGEVTQILISFNDQHTNAFIPVMIEIDKGKLQDRIGESIDLKAPHLMQNAIDHGLRARLQFQSFVTGVLYIELNYFSDAPPARYIVKDTKWQEIPTMASGGLGDVWKQAGKMFADISKVDFKGLGEQLMGLLTDLRGDLHDLNFKELNASFIGAANSIEHFVTSPELSGTFTSTKHAMDEISKFTAHVDSRLDPMADEFESAMAKFRCTFGHLDAMLEPQSQFRYRMDSALQEFAEASKAVRDLANYIERNPQSLLKGKAPPAANKNVPR